MDMFYSFINSLAAFIGFAVLFLVSAYVVYTFLVEFLIRHIVISITYFVFVVKIENVHGKGTAIRPGFIKKYPKTYYVRVFLMRMFSKSKLRNYSTTLDSPYGTFSTHTFIPRFKIRGKFVDEKE